MTIEEKVEEIKENLDFFDDELQKYEYIIDLGKRLEEIPDEFKVDEYKVPGCTSQVWLICEQKDNNLCFKGTSDAIIVKGLVYIILDIFSRRSIDELKDVKMDIVGKLGLSEVITPNRQSGIMGMMRKIEIYSKKAWEKREKK